MKRLGELTVGDLMTENPVCVYGHDLLAETITIFEESDVSAMPVLEPGRKVVGILSLVDLLEFVYDHKSDLGGVQHAQGRARGFLLKMFAQELRHSKVEDAMTTDVKTVSPEINAAVAANLMLTGRFRHLPVVDDQGQVTGMLSATDFVRAFAVQAPMLAG
jgi:CBS domain-containing membrane protein